MKRIIGMAIGVAYFGLAFGALVRAGSGWDTGYSDVGFWWTVIAVILAIAGSGAMIGTWIHTQNVEG